MKTEVIIQFNVEGFHQWVDAIPEVEFLKFPHFHTFTMRVAFEVSHDDREREIFMERDAMKQYFSTKYGERKWFEGRSCEHIAKEILELDPAITWAEVWEEQTGGARVSR